MKGGGVTFCSRRKFMTTTEGINPWRGLAPLALMILLLTGGCNSKTDPEAARLQAEQARAAQQLAALTNQLAAVRAEQTETVNRLLARLEQLERQEAVQASAAQTDKVAQEAQVRSQAALLAAHEEQAKQFTERIRQLEGQVGALQAGRLLPEITLPSDDAPTVQELEQKILIAERKRELDAEAAEARARAQPQLSIGEQGVSFRSADTNFTLRLRGLVQLDSRTFFKDDEFNEGNDTFLLRRARPIIEGTVFRDFNYRLQPDFGGSSPQIFDASLTYRLRPELSFTAGKFKGPVGLEQLYPVPALSFNERGLVSSLVPSRNIGVAVSGELAGGRVEYAAGVFNVAGDGRNPDNVDFGDDKEYAGRLFFRPFLPAENKWLKDLGFGVGGSYSQISSNAVGLPATRGGRLPGYTTPAGQQFFAYNPLAGPVVGDGSFWRVSPQLEYRVGPFGLLGEYAISRHAVYNSTTFRSADLEHHAWQVAAQWVLTGERASFTGITPSRPFSLSGGGWGAWQLVGRYGQLDIDDGAFQGFANPATSASQATSWSVGVNWWLNRNVRLLTSFTHSSFEGGGAPASVLDPSTFLPPSTVTRRDENALMTRIQLGF